MIVSELFDGWGNKLIQQTFARVLAHELNYYVESSKIPGVSSSGNYSPSPDCVRVEHDNVFISHKSHHRHKVDIDELKKLTPCKFTIHSYLEYYPNFTGYENLIKNKWTDIMDPINNDVGVLRGRFKRFINGNISPVSVDNITADDLVISIRLGRDYLGQHRFRLLLGDYFKIVLNNCEYDRLFITSQDPYNTILEDLYNYNPIFLDHVSPLHTFNFVKMFNKIALSQSTYSWWAGYLSDAKEIYFPITKDGPWSYGKHQRDKWKAFSHDLMVPEERYKYVSYQERCLLGNYTECRESLGI